MKNFRDFSNLDEKVVNVVQRKKLARRMSKLAKSSAFQAKKKRTLMRIRGSVKLLSAAKKKTVMAFRKKLYPGYVDMSMPQKVKADQVVLQRFGAKIDKVAKKTAKKIEVASTHVTASEKKERARQAAPRTIRTCI